MPRTESLVLERFLLSFSLFFYGILFLFSSYFLLTGQRCGAVRRLHSRHDQRVQERARAL